MELPVAETLHLGRWRGSKRSSAQMIASGPLVIFALCGLRVSCTLCKRLGSWWNCSQLLDI